MRTFVLVWVWFAFSILGFTFFTKTETLPFSLDVKSKFYNTYSPEDRYYKPLPIIMGNDITPIYPPSFQHAATDFMGISMKTFDFTSEIYIKTSTINKENARIKLQSHLKEIGSDSKTLFLPGKSQKCIAQHINSPKLNNTPEDNWSKVIPNAFHINNTSSSNPFFLSDVQIIDQDRITLSFSLPLNPKTAIFPSNFLISGSNPMEILLLDNTSTIDLILAKPLKLGDNINIHIKALQSVAGEEIKNFTVQKIYSDGIKDIIIDQHNIIKIVHEVPVTLSENTESFYILDASLNIKAEIDPNQPTALLIKVTPPLEEGIAYQLKIPQRFTGKDWISGAIRDLSWDNTPPQPVMLERLNADKFIIHFDEPVDEVMSMVSNHFLINGQEPIEAVPSREPNKVVLGLNLNLEKNDNIELIIRNIQDKKGNILEQSKIYLNLEKDNEPHFKEVVINEIMAAPRAGNVLPNAEYVEIYNTGVHEIQMGGFRLHNSRSGTAIPQSTIMPGEYVILCPNSQRQNFQTYGKVIGLTSWPTLLNAGDQVKIFDSSGNVIDSLNYNTQSYGSSQLAQGGYSLEVVNPYLLCNQANNLKPSTSPMRGTPGLVNSVYDNTPDRTQPKISQVTVIDNYHLSVGFSKPMSQEILKENLKISPAIDILDVQFVPGDLTSIIINFSKPLDGRTRYTLLVENIRDCGGNLIHPLGNSAVFVVPSPAEAGEIVINEILFNPHSGTPKFVELYNKSPKWINIKNWKLANESAGEIANRRVLSGEDFIMEPYAYLAINVNSELLSQIYPKAMNLLQLSSIPSYPIREGTVLLLDPEEELLERLDYHENYHHPLLRDPKGVSLERLDPGRFANEPQNWASAAASVGYATPGFQNSQVYPENNLPSGINILPEVFSPDAISGQNFTTINYDMDSPGYVGTIKIYDLNGKLIKDIVQNDTWGNKGFYIWNGTDTNGKKVRTGYYICWIELLNLKGNVFHIKKTVVIATKLR